MNEGYKKVVGYVFDCDGETFMISEFDNDRVFVEETRKNGQEDCHFGGEILRGEDGTWKFEDRSYYRDESTHNGIEAHLNKYGPPVAE